MAATTELKVKAVEKVIAASNIRLQLFRIQRENYEPEKHIVGKCNIYIRSYKLKRSTSGFCN